MIEFHNVTKRYGFGEEALVALDEVSLNVRAGEIFGVIGPSGAGKSTLLRCVNLLEEPTHGTLTVGGREITSLTNKGLRHARHDIGMIFQHFNLMQSHTVFENIALPLRLKRISNNAIEQIITPLLKLVGLTDRQGAYPSQLSGGQKQRVAIARALTTQPKILLCDEATSALDPQTTHTILQLLKDINEKMGVTVLLITHEMSVVKEICHRLAIMENGKIIEQSSVLDFFANPESDLAKQFLRQDIEAQFPENIRVRLTTEANKHSAPLWRLSFVGDTAEQPLIAHLMQEKSISLNILLANIESIRDQMVGTMVVEAEGDDNKLAAGIAYLREHAINVEVIGYVNSNA